jgi:hypothetical protein
VLGRIQADGEYVRLDVAGCAIDVLHVFDLAQRVRSIPDGHLTQESLDEMDGMLSRAAEEFLPDWEETEQRGGSSESGASEVVMDVRGMVADAYVTLAAALADAYHGRRQSDRAIAYLMDALRRRPERVELARRLVRVYDQAGLARRAAELRAEYGIDEVGRSPPLLTLGFRSSRVSNLVNSTTANMPARVMTRQANERRYQTAHDLDEDNER